MDARAKTVRDIIGTKEQYIIPFFQRDYTWSTSNWKQILEDIGRIAESDNNKNDHFFGPIVCTSIANSMPGEVRRHQLIDGQQRLTTVFLMLAALRELIDDEVSKEDITEDYLINKNTSSEYRYKLSHRFVDRNAFIAIIDQKDLSKYKKFNIYKCYSFFCREFKKLSEEFNCSFENLKGIIIDRLSFVFIQIDAANAYEIFESLNSTGKPLEQSDLVRNFVFMKLGYEQEKEFHDNYWFDYESLFNNELLVSKGSKLKPQEVATSFYRNYLMMKTAKSCNKKDIYITFKELFRDESKKTESLIDLVSELTKYVKYGIRFGGSNADEHAKLDRSFAHLRSLDQRGFSHPLLFVLYDKYKEGLIECESLNNCLQFLCSYLIRRPIVDPGFRLYGKLFLGAINELHDENICDSLSSYLENNEWPGDGQFLSAMAHFDLYKKQPMMCRMLLDELEHSFGHKERVNPEELTIEHVMPQTIHYSHEPGSWPEMIPGNEDADWLSLKNSWLHTLGNLTLTGYNTELSNEIYSKKKPQLCNKSKVSLNEYFQGIDSWTASEIKKRGFALAEKLAEIWPAPNTKEPTKHDEPKKPSFDVNELRRVAVERIGVAWGKDFYLEKGKQAIFCDEKNEIFLVAPTSKVYQAGSGAVDGGYWFGFKPVQIPYLTENSKAFILFVCGSDKRLLLFPGQDWLSIYSGLNTTVNDDGSTYHWHVQIDWDGDKVSLDQADKNKLDISKYIFDELS